MAVNRIKHLLKKLGKIVVWGFIIQIAIITLLVIGLAIFTDTDKTTHQSQPTQQAQPKTPKQMRLERLAPQFAKDDHGRIYHINLVRYIKGRMYYPRSFENVETTFIDMDDYLLVFMTFRGKNPYGAVVQNEVTAEVDLDGNIIKVDVFPGPGMGDWGTLGLFNYVKGG